jgi:hypothetical protein
MATAGSPAIATPWRPRAASSVCQVGATAQRMAQRAEPATDQRMRTVRPYTSDKGPAIRSATARPKVANETLNALWLGDTSYASTRSGSSAWVL